MGAPTQQPQPSPGYTYRAKVIAANFVFSTGVQPDFGDEFTLEVNTNTPGLYRKPTGGQTGSYVSFADSWVEVSCEEKPGGVHTTIATAALSNFNVKGILTADLLKCRVMTVYHDAWGDPKKSTYARALPLLPEIQNLKIYGVPFRLGQELQLPEPFNYDDAGRSAYFNGQGPEIQPAGISQVPGRRIPTAQGDIELSDDTRRITVPNFGIVNIADWQPWKPDSRTSGHWVQLIGLNLSNPTTGGGSGAGGNGSSGGG